MGIILFINVNWSCRDHSTQLKIEKVYKMVIVFSMLLGIAAVLFLALTGETYATALAFLLLVLKAGLYMKGR